MMSQSIAERAVDTPPTVLPRLLHDGSVIQFRCTRGIGCWNACCSNIDIPLTPSDILRLSRRLALGSTSFLQRHTFPYEMERDGLAVEGGLPGVKLRPVADGTACPFVTEDGCSVYEDRPTACRYYPLALLSLRKQDESADRTAYALVREPHCLGHAQPRRVAIAEYRCEQNVEASDVLDRGWRQLILKKRSSGTTVGRPSARSLQLFFMACYDIDRFRAFVGTRGFHDLFAMTAPEREVVQAGDEALLLFAFRFLKQVLFGERTIALDETVAAARRARPPCSVRGP